jgi:glycosyltransferase involved in cell wall biosynthesis
MQLLESSIDRRPFVSVLVPGYNEQAVIEHNLMVLCDHMTSLEDRYRWEIVFVDDGSTDGTGALADRFARAHPNVRVLHHPVNFGLGQALKYGFSHCRGEYIVTLDIDLSYSPDHIERLLARIRSSPAKIVVASPYMEGGKISNIPWLRRTLSIWANRFLAFASNSKLSTLTGLTRVYDAQFVRSLNIRALGSELNSKILHQANVLQAKVEQIPGHLDWSLQNGAAARTSSMKIARQTRAVLLSGFLFHPVMFFIAPGLLLLLFSGYAGTWAVIHTYTNAQALALVGDHDLTNAVAAAFRQAPHVFFLGGIALLLAMQFLSLGILAMQSKSYFDELFFLTSAVYRELRNGDLDTRTSHHERGSH